MALLLPASAVPVHHTVVPNPTEVSPVLVCSELQTCRGAAMLHALLRLSCLLLHSHIGYGSFGQTPYDPYSVRET